jgi:membrane associated rhomboid family serine protease
MPDLPRRRTPQRPSWTEPIIQRLTTSVKTLVIAQAAVFFLYVFVRDSRGLIVAHLTVSPNLFRGEVWQPLTSAFVHTDFWSFLFNLLGIWWVGSTFEGMQGTRRFLWLLIGGSALANLTVGLLRFFRPGEPVAGCAFGLLALLVGLGAMFGRQPVQVWRGLFLQGRVLAAVFVGWFIVAAMLTLDWPSVVGALVATAVGYFGGARGSLQQLSDLVRGGGGKGRRYRVIEGGAPRRGRSPKYWN